MEFGDIVITPQRLSDRLARLYSQAILIREVEQRLLELFSLGRLQGTVHTCLGQEWTGIAIAEHLTVGDFICSNHRCHGHFLARTNDVEGLIAEVMGKQTGVCGGRGGSQHLYCPGFLSNGVQGGITPVAAGIAYSLQLKNTSNLAVAFIGDGTLGEGAVYETMNLASKWQLPLLIVVENNLYSQSTSQHQTLAGGICARASAFGIETAQASTWDVEHLLATVESSTTTIREQRGPVFLQIDTYRLAAHSKGDDDRDHREISNYRERDPTNRFIHDFPDQSSQFATQARSRIDAAVQRADAAPFAEFVSSSEEHGRFEGVEWHPVPEHPSDRCVGLIRKSLEEALIQNDRVILLGEDIESPYGGAFKATAGLSDRHRERVRNTPISESLIVGLGNGLALAGMIPVCEIMFGDFLTLAADQLINHASKFRFMYNNQVRVPLIVRTPMGGRRGYGPTHSQSLEKHFLGLPDLQVLAINHRQDPGRLYARLFETIEGPTLVIENKVLYGHRMPSEVPRGYAFEETGERYPTLRIRPFGKPDVTIVCFGEMLREAEEAVLAAFDEHEIICEVICPVRISPLNIVPILESVKNSRRLGVVEEGIGVAGFGSEVVARVVETEPGICQAIRRLSSPMHPIPACAELERTMLPNRNSILHMICELVDHV